MVFVSRSEKRVNYIKHIVNWKKRAPMNGQGLELMTVCVDEQWGAGRLPVGQVPRGEAATH